MERIPRGDNLVKKTAVEATRNPMPLSDDQLDVLGLFLDGLVEKQQHGDDHGKEGSQTSHSQGCQNRAQLVTQQILANKEKELHSVAPSLHPIALEALSRGSNSLCCWRTPDPIPLVGKKSVNNKHQKQVGEVETGTARSHPTNL